jgi:glycosyltransferase involved in cell wall biosynthesis
MRILIATHHRTVIGGAETYLREIVPALSARGHDLALFTEKAAMPGRPVIDEQAGRLPVWCGEGQEPGVALRAIQDWGPDVVYSQGLENPDVEEEFLGKYATALFAHNYRGTCISGSKRFAFPRVRPCCRAFGPACLALYYPRRCGGLNPWSMVRQYRLQRRRRGVVRSCSAVLVASRHMRDEYRRHGVAEERLHLVPLFPPGQEREPEPPAARPCGGRVLFIGRLTNLKGGRLLLRAMQVASARLGRPLELTVAGDGPERSRLETLAGRLGVRAEFLGWTATPRRIALMRAADVLAVPSVWPEPFGLIGIEAGCVGLPAVAFAVGGIPEWLRPGESGELAPGDPPTGRGLADALVRALAREDHLQRLRQGAWRVAGEFTREAHLERLEAILEGCRARPA